MSSTVRALMSVLHGVKDMTFDEFDAIEDDLHSTLVMRALKPFDYEKIWEYLNKQEGMDLTVKFDNIAVLKKEDNKWVVDRVWELLA